MTATLITPLVQGLTQSLTGFLGKIPGMGGIFGGGAAATAAGGLGSLFGGLFSSAPAWQGPLLPGTVAPGSTGLMAGLGGLLTNPWTAVVAGGIIGTTAWIKSQAHHEANTFVQEFQNPFGEMLGTIVDGFNAAAAAGELTKQGGQAALDSVRELWDTFSTQAKEFAKGGSDEALVAKQAFETLTPLLTQIFADMESTVGGLVDVTEDLDEAVQELSEDAKRTLGFVQSVTLATAGASNLAEALAQLEAMGSPAALILDRLGSDIESFVHLLTLSGETVPPLLQKYFDMIQAGAAVTDIVTDVVDAITEKLPTAGPFAPAAGPTADEQVRQFIAAMQANPALMGPQQIVLQMDGRVVAATIAPHTLSLARNQGMRVVGTR
jgi:hypothetical protein